VPAACLRVPAAWVAWVAWTSKSNRLALKRKGKAWQRCRASAASCNSSRPAWLRCRDTGPAPSA
jgi:hypothetical protein